MDTTRLQDRYNQLLDEEAALVDAMYDLEIEEMSYIYEDVLPETIREAKRKAGKEYDDWWTANKAEYESLRVKIYNGY